MEMQVALVLLTAVVAITTAIRSTWSPCGVSMLSTITPLAESSRGYRFRSTARWFVLGSILGGVCLGGLIALLALTVGALRISSLTALLLVAAAALVTAASDARLGGFRIPDHDRQVNERWLDRYRSWVYGAGFGWQIGAGLTTYIMTSAVYLLILMGATTGNPIIALGAGVLFGLIRGLAVYLARPLDTREKLLTFHARFEHRRESVRRWMIVVQAAVAIVAVAVASAGPALLAISLMATLVIAVTVRGPKESVELAPAPIGAVS
jgi:MFS family permease